MTVSKLFLKQIDHLVGRIIASLLPSPVRRDVPFTPSSVLVIRPGGIGDAVLLVPVVRALRRRFPQISIDILAERRNAGVFALCPGIRSIRCYDMPAEFRDTFKYRYDIVIDTEQWHRLSAVMAWIVRAETKIGFATNNRGRLFTHPISYNQDIYEAVSFRHLLFPLECDGEWEVDTLFLAVDDRDAEIAGTLLQPLEGRPFVALFPGASIAERRWGAEKFAELATRLQKRIEVVTVGGTIDQQDATVIEQSRVLNLAGKTTLAETAAIIARSSLLVSGDSGILHIAVGLGVPTVSLFGPGRAKKWAPRGNNHIVINNEFPCSPCTTFGYTPKCPTSARCMAEITVDEVEQAVVTLLARKNFDKREQKS
jgi:lipopolysaccharide heptosyltransferase II